MKSLVVRSLARETVRGGAVLAVGSGLENLIRFGRNLILVRILAPEAFGLMAIILSIVAAFETFTDMGVKYAIIQNPRGKEPTYLNAAWWTAAGRGVLLYAALFAFAHPVAVFYERPDLVPLMRVACLAVPLRALMSIAVYVAIKDMQFWRWAVAAHGGAALGVSVTIGLAFLLSDVWALVFGLTIEALLICILSYVLCPFAPTFAFKSQDTRALYGYARGMVGLPILYFIFMRTDLFVVGKLCSATSLGVYAMALGLARTPFQMVDAVVVQLAMPVLSALRSQTNKLRDAILQFSKFLAFISMPSLAFVLVHGSDILGFVYGPQYAHVGLVFALAFAAAMLQSLSVPITTAYFALGRPALQRSFSLVRAAFLVVIIVPLVLHLQLTGAALAVVLAMLVGYIVQVVKLRSLVGFEIRSLGRCFAGPAVAGAGVYVIAAASKELWDVHQPWGLVPGVIGLTAACMYAASAFWRLRHDAPKATDLVATQQADAPAQNVQSVT